MVFLLKWYVSLEHNYLQEGLNSGYYYYYYLRPPSCYNSENGVRIYGREMKQKGLRSDWYGTVIFTMYWCASPKGRHHDSHCRSCEASGLDLELGTGSKSAMKEILRQK